MTHKPLVPFSTWEQLDLRVGTILEVEDHPNATKLYVLKVDLGEETPRTIVAGLKGRYDKPELLGKQGIFIANLEPAVLRGVNSEGMTLAAANSDDSIVVLITPDKEIEPGSNVR